MKKNNQTRGLLKGGKIGNKGGTGRPKKEIKELCRNVVFNKKLIDRLVKFASGEDVHQVVNDEGEIIPIPCPPKVQLDAIRELLDRGWGKPSQEIQGTFNVNTIIDEINKRFE